MSFWDDSFKDVVRRAALVSTGADGDPTYGPVTSLAARVQRGRDRDSEEVTHTAVVYTSTEVAVTDRLWLPGDAQTAAAARRPVAVYKTHDLDSAEDVLYKVLL